MWASLRWVSWHIKSTITFYSITSSCRWIFYFFTGNKQKSRNKKTKQKNTYIRARTSLVLIKHTYWNPTPRYVSSPLLGAYKIMLNNTVPVLTLPLWPIAHLFLQSLLPCLNTIYKHLKTVKVRKRLNKKVKGIEIEEASDIFSYFNIEGPIFVQKQSILLKWFEKFVPTIFYNQIIRVREVLYTKKWYSLFRDFQKINNYASYLGSGPWFHLHFRGK